MDSNAMFSTLPGTGKSTLVKHILNMYSEDDIFDMESSTMGEPSDSVCGTSASLAMSLAIYR